MAWQRHLMLDAYTLVTCTWAIVCSADGILGIAYPQRYIPLPDWSTTHTRGTYGTYDSNDTPCIMEHLVHQHIWRATIVIRTCCCRYVVGEVTKGFGLYACYALVPPYVLLFVHYELYMWWRMGTFTLGIIVSEQCAGLKLN